MSSMHPDLEHFTAGEILEQELKELINKKYGGFMKFSGVIKKIHPLQPTKAGGRMFRRIEFVLDDGTWCKTDVVQGFRNSKRWQQGVDLGVGTRVKFLEMRDTDTVNADSMVRFSKTL